MSIEQLVLFTTDANGLERTLRLVQSLLQIVVSVPVLLAAVAAWLLPVSGAEAKATSNSAAAVYEVATMLVGARDRVNLVRRVFRMFRFIESSHNAHRLYSGLFAAPEQAQDPSKTAARRRRRRYDPWLDAFAATFAGLYLILETATLLDALDVPGLAVWGPERADRLNVEGQRYWFLSLSCSVLAGVLRMANVTRDLPLPPPTEAEKEGNMGSRLGDGDGDEDNNSNGEESDAKDEKKLEALNEERLRLRRIVQGRMAQRRVWQRALRDRLVVLGRRVVADAADVLLPGTIVGWTPLAPATVGYVMGFTTLLTGYDVWLRCGREAAARRA
ncbi:hypothetical protein SCUCBS95973_002071 [Sporothrix curviconia]|uniref:AoPex11B-like protein n=1 Tax=Sporothrix curviconia TaxID=1260050 RepID=A0ABP0B3Y7_9PEZI